MRAALIDVFRGLAAAGVLLSAAVHLVLYFPPNDFKDISTIGPLFLLNGIGGIVLGVVVTSWRHWLPALGAAGFGAITVIFFWISVIHGIFGFKEPLPTVAVSVLAEVAEYGAVLFGLLAAGALWWERSARVSRRRADDVTQHRAAHA
jgi:hypothetical protein